MRIKNVNLNENRDTIENHQSLSLKTYKDDITDLPKLICKVIKGNSKSFNIIFLSNALC